MVALGLHCCVWLLSSCRVWASHYDVFSCCREWAQELRLSSYGTRTQVILCHVESSWTWNQTCIPALAGRFLTTEPVGKFQFLIFEIDNPFSNNLKDVYSTSLYKQWELRFLINAWMPYILLSECYATEYWFSIVWLLQSRLWGRSALFELDPGRGKEFIFYLSCEIDSDINSTQCQIWPSLPSEFPESYSLGSNFF